MSNLNFFKNLVQKSQAGPNLPSAQPGARFSQPMQQAGQNPVPNMMQQAGFTQNESAAAGRLGDSIIAHLTPGEITIPPQIQTPKVIEAVKAEFEKQGVDPSKFVAGSQSNSTNPNTGMPEFNFWSSFLPIAAGIGGSLIAPGIGTALGSTMGAGTLGAIGGGVGTTLGGMAAGQNAGDALMTGGMSGLGSYGLGQLVNAAASPAANAGTNLVSNLNPGAASTLSNPSLTSTSNWANLYGALPNGSNVGNVLGGMAGSLAANGINKQSTKTTSPNYPSGFTDKMPAVGDLPSYQELLGQNTTKSPAPNFANYNPYTLKTNSYNFYPISAIKSA